MERGPLSNWRLQPLIVLAAAGLFAATAAAEVPSVTGVRNFLSDEPFVAPGTVAHVYGHSLSTQRCVISEMTLPKVACGVRVLIGNTEAALFVVTPIQLMIQIPYEAEPGNTTVVVQSLEGRSYPLPITLQSHAPGISRRDHVAADLGSFNAPDGLVDFENPAEPAEVLSVGVVGLGPTEPPVATGERVVGVHQTVDTPTIELGCLRTEASSSGLVPGFPGFYSVRFEVPDTTPGGYHDVTLTIGGQTSNQVFIPVSGDAVPAVCAVVNGASFAASHAAPGSIMSLFAMNIGFEFFADIFPDTEFNRVSVTFNNLPAPLFAVDPARLQINLLAPTELPESGEVEVRVTNEAGESLAFILEMTEADPGIFPVRDPTDNERVFAAATLANTRWFALPDTTAEAIGLPINCSDGGVDPLAFCAEPVRAGDTLSVFVTGLGRATIGGDPDGTVLPTGELAPEALPLFETVHTPAVTFGEVPGTVRFSGLAPGNAGLYQVNVEVPQGVPTGDAVSMTLTMPNGRSDSASVAISP